MPLFLSLAMHCTYYSLSYTVLSRSGESRRPCLGHLLAKSIPLSVSAVGFLSMSFLRLRKFSPISSLLRGCFFKSEMDVGFWILSNAFYVSIETSHDFILVF